MTRYAEDAARRILLDDATYAAITTRIYPLAAPQRAAMPYTITETSPEEPSHHLANEAGVTESMVELFHYSTDYDQARSMGEAARLALCNQRGTVNISGETLHLESCRLQETNLTHLPDQGGGEIGIFECRQLFRIWTTTTNP